MNRRRPWIALCLACWLGIAGGLAAADSAWFEIDCVDAATGRGLPLVELETVNHLRFVSDNAGRVAFHEPGLMGQEVYFHVRSHGYEVPKDGMDYRGVRLTPVAGGRTNVTLTRLNIAERCVRLTGEGRWRDSQLLGYPVPDGAANPGRVAGQDSVEVARYQGKLYWFWGDTDRMGYPLGHFRTSGATSPLLDYATLQPEVGIPYNYFTGANGFSRPMIPLPERPEGVIWIDGLVTVLDADGRERLVCHYSRRKGLGKQYEHGLAVFNDDQNIFEPTATLPEEEKWRFLQGQTTLVDEGGERWIYCGVPLLHVRVPARFEAVRDSAAYEAFTCLEAGSDPKQANPVRNAAGQVAWAWRKDAPPVSSAQESRWLKAGKIQPSECRFSPVVGEHRPLLHVGTVRWNRFRQRWVAIVNELGQKPSVLGEVYYTESSSPVGPFTTAVKILTHDRMSFYNPCQHAFLDSPDGRFIYFEGTYVNTFSGNPDATPRYNYNQILYRLDLADPRLKGAHADTHP